MAGRPQEQSQSGLCNHEGKTKNEDSWREENEGREDKGEMYLLKIHNKTKIT